MSTAMRARLVLQGWTAAEIAAADGLVRAGVWSARLVEIVAKGMR